MSMLMYMFLSLTLWLCWDLFCADVDALLCVPNTVDIGVCIDWDVALLVQIFVCAHVHVLVLAGDAVHIHIDKAYVSM